MRPSWCANDPRFFSPVFHWNTPLRLSSRKWCPDCDVTYTLSVVWNGVVTVTSLTLPAKKAGQKQHGGTSRSVLQWGVSAFCYTSTAFNCPFGNWACDRHTITGCAFCKFKGVFVNTILFASLSCFPPPSYFLKPCTRGCQYVSIWNHLTLIKGIVTVYLVHHLTARRCKGEASASAAINSMTLYSMLYDHVM